MATLEEEHQALLQFLYLAPVGLAQLKMDGEIVMINPLSAQLLMPLSPDGSLNNLFAALETIAPELRHLCASFEEPYGMICDATRLQVNAGIPGRSDPQILSLTLLKLDAARLMAVISDVSVQVKRERQLQQHEAWFNAILHGMTDYALVSLDGKGGIEQWNESIGRVTGHDAAAVLNRPYSIFFPEGATTEDSLQDRLQDADMNGWSLQESYCRRADGTRFWASTLITPLRVRNDAAHIGAIRQDMSDCPSYCLVVRDIDEKREASESRRKALLCDHLTGVANRRAFFDAAELEFERMRRSPRPLSLVLFDADSFKSINDRYGHPVGDTVLRHFAETLQDTFRQIDIVARIGGEEFAVILPSTDMPAALAAAERLRAAIEGACVNIDGLHIRYTVSGGIASVDGDVSGIDELIKRADTALYVAKAEGRNRVRTWGTSQARLLEMVAS
ncbi:sensor domain-containing diguanylate cyclase [Noviherbaspirillum aerium]|uniref:sensor domain-containing diguanylate cyclase n=1 Tax=Noviherbaspirillum aerium TaxID=2588497 RepID=UPI00124ED9A0|nr:sensor domain-containing diguanylate cyclase [Noviherbaspirillum aerium]